MVIPTQHFYRVSLLSKISYWFDFVLHFFSVFDAFVEPIESGQVGIQWKGLCVMTENRHRHFKSNRIRIWS